MANAKNFTQKGTSGAKARKSVLDLDPYKHPRHKIAFLVVICIFGVGVVLTAIHVIHCWCIIDNENRPTTMIVDLKNIWEFLLPIITLVLGYEFGRSEAKN